MWNDPQDFWNLLDQLMTSHQIVVDRVKGSAHPKYSDFIYPVDYGFLKGTSSADREGIDVWIGSMPAPKRVSGIITTVDVIKNDSEVKILWGCTPEEIGQICEVLNRTANMKGLLSLREKEEMAANEH
ncbi:MAG: hypothetical protein IJQ31_05975 [Thermoguttaceae bacterium]|nr:hypothetical protein [Thermoguttaceae bacterium]